MIGLRFNEKVLSRDPLKAPKDGSHQDKGDRVLAQQLYSRLQGSLQLPEKSAYKVFSNKILKMDFVQKTCWLVALSSLPSF